MPIVVVMSSEHHARADGVDDGFTDVLVEPYSPNYARLAPRTDRERMDRLRGYELDQGTLVVGILHPFEEVQSL